MSRGALRGALLRGAVLLALGLAGSITAGASVPPVAEIRSQMPTVRLDRLAYADRDELTARIDLRPGSAAALVADLLFVTDSLTGDIEQVPLEKIAALTLGTKKPLPVRFGAVGSAPKPLDGVLSARPGSVLLAQVAYYLDGDKARPFAAADFGLAVDERFTGSPVLVDPKLALYDRELNQPGAERPVTTIVAKGAPLPVQVPVRELLFRPSSREQLDSFLESTGGHVVATDGLSDRPEEQWHVVALKPNPDAALYAPQMRSVVGDESLLAFSSEEGLSFYATVLELWLEGYRVAFNPRVQLHRSLDTLDASPGSPFPRDAFGRLAYDDPLFGLDDLWLYMAQTDADSGTVPVAFVDQGFAPDPDYRGFPSFREVDVDTGRVGAGEATGPPTVGSNFFGGRSWHGSGVVHTAGAVINNGYGTLGVGGQVVVPMLYEMNRNAYALKMGEAIRRAVDDGASIVNVSAGYPCRILWTLGPDEICTAGGRAAFIAKLTAAAETAALATCAALGGIPVIGQAVCAGILAAATAGVEAQVASVFLGEVSGPVEAAVAYAVSRGVPVVASAGNRLTDETLGPLAPFVDNSPENGSIDEWLVIPAAVPGCIAVAAADGVNDGNNKYPNRHFFGDRVAVWAPIRTLYFEPMATTAAAFAAGPGAHVSSSFGGTSAAAPYVSGVIADMMAMHPQLDPRNLAPTERPGNVTRILVLLLDAAYRPGDGFLPSESSIQNDPRLPAETKADLLRRRNLINPFGSVRRAAALEGIPLFDRLPANYDGDYGLRDDFAGSQAAAEAAGDLYTMAGHRWEFQDEIGRMLPQSWRIPPAPTVAGLDVRDTDWLILRSNTSPGLYRSRIEARIPWHEHGRLLINNRSGRWEQPVAGEERVFSWTTPQVFNGMQIPLQLVGRNLSDDDADFPYKLTIFPADIEPPPPEDAYETPRDNDWITRASPLRFDPCDEWGEVFTGGTDFSQIELRAFEHRIDGLTIHSADDEDWFALTLRGGCLPEDCEDCPPELTVFLNGDRQRLFVEIYDDAEQLLTRGEGDRYFRVRCDDYLGKMPLYLRIRAPEPVAAHYSLRFRWSILSEELCCDSAYRQMADRFVHDWRCDLDALIRRFADRRLDAGRELLLPIRDPFGEGAPRLLGGGIMPDPGPVSTDDWPVDALGRTLRAETFLVEVGPGGRFRALIETGAEQPLVARLWGGEISRTGPGPALIAEAGTPAAADALRLFDGGGGPPRGERPSARVGAKAAPAAPGFLEIAAEGLAPGYYTLALSRFYVGTRAIVYLSKENQADDSFPTVEAVLAPDSSEGPPPETGYLYGPPEAAADQGPPPDSWSVLLEEPVRCSPRPDPD